MELKSTLRGAAQPGSWLPSAPGSWQDLQSWAPGPRRGGSGRRCQDL